jgi:hypothetical protein
MPDRHYDPSARYPRLAGTPDTPTFQVHTDADGARGDILRPLVALLRALAARRRPVLPDLGPPTAATASPAATPNVEAIPKEGSL